jgi:hypothetical protein
LEQKIRQLAEDREPLDKAFSRKRSFRKNIKRTLDNPNEED